MTEIFAFSLSSIIAFYTHSVAEKFLSRGEKKNVRLIFHGIQIHHSFWGAMIAVIGLIFASGVFATVLFGYGVGNIFQHKVTHNRINEKGMVFLTKVTKA